MDLEILTPAVRAKPVFPRWTLYLIAPLLLLSVVTALVGPSILDFASMLSTPFAAVGAVVIASWVESRLFFATHRLPFIVRMFIALVVPPVSLAVGLTAFALLTWPTAFASA